MGTILGVVVGAKRNLQIAKKKKWTNAPNALRERANFVGARVRRHLMKILLNPSELPLHLSSVICTDILIRLKCSCVTSATSGDDGADNGGGGGLDIDDGKLDPGDDRFKNGPIAGKKRGLYRKWFEA